MALEAVLLMDETIAGKIEQQTSNESDEEELMHIITRKRLNEFADKYPETASALANWYRQLKQNNFASFAELRAMFPSADQVGKLTVFNIGGNKVRLVAAIHYNRK